MVEDAVFAAGCFWGVEEYFLRLPGVESTQVGYTGGKLQNPSYEEVCTGKSGHAEVVWVSFDPQIIRYTALLENFFQMHDPTSLNRQGPDSGTQYRSAIFTTSGEQYRQALDFKKTLGPEVVTEVLPLSTFWPAEDVHQKYLRKNPGATCHVKLPPLAQLT